MQNHVTCELDKIRRSKRKKRKYGIDLDGYITTIPRSRDEKIRWELDAVVVFGEQMVKA